MIQLNTPISLPSQSLVLECVQTRNFALRCKITLSDKYDTGTLIRATDSALWPVFHVTFRTNEALRNDPLTHKHGRLWIGIGTGKSDSSAWSDSYTPVDVIPDNSELIVNFFDGVMHCYLNRVLIAADNVKLDKNIASWVLGNPLMVYGASPCASGITVSNLEIRDVAYLTPFTQDKADLTQCDYEANFHVLDYLEDQIGISGKECSLLKLDIDKMGDIANTCSWGDGLHVIDQVYALCKSCVGDRLIARTHYHQRGDDFLVFLRDTGLLQATELAEKIRLAVESSMFTLLDNKAIRRTISIGVAQTTDQVTTLANLYSMADLCLFKAKRSGRNKVVSMLEIP